MVKLRLKELRIECNLTQEQLSKIINLTQSTIAGYENGSKSPSMETIILLAELFSVSTDYLLGVSNIRNYEKQQINNTGNFIKLFESKYDKLEDDFKLAINTIGTTLIDNLYNLQSNNQDKYNANHEDDDIARELESYRQELNASNKKLPQNPMNTSKRNA